MRGARGRTRGKRSNLIRGIQFFRPECRRRAPRKSSDEGTGGRGRTRRTKASCSSRNAFERCEDLRNKRPYYCERAMNHGFIIESKAPLLRLDVYFPPPRGLSSRKEERATRNEDDFVLSFRINHLRYRVSTRIL